MHRFYIPAAEWNRDRLRLTGGEAHHCRNVLRLRAGDRAVVFNGAGAEATTEIVSTGGDEIALKSIHQSSSAPLPCRITLGQAIPKGKNMDLIIQKATELGVSSIAPLLSERTVIRLDSDEALDRQSKWQTVVIEAAKQCGQNWLPTVHPPRTIKEFFADPGKFDLLLIASLQPDALRLKDLLHDYEARHQSRPGSVLVLVGPEGDFTPAEMGLARSSNCLPITLGPVVLRTETAALYCLSVLSYELLIP